MTAVWKADMIWYKLKNRAKGHNPISVVASRVGCNRCNSDMQEGAYHTKYGGGTVADHRGALNPGLPHTFHYSPPPSQVALMDWCSRLLKGAIAHDSATICCTFQISLLFVLVLVIFKSYTWLSVIQQDNVFQFIVR